MSLKNSILSLIDLRPMTGYELVKVYNYAILFFWHATHTQVYRTLKNLEGSGFVEGEIVVQHANPSKKVYSITESGKAQLKSWLKEMPELPKFRHSFLLKLSMSKNLSEETLTEQLKSYKSQLEKRLAFLESEEKKEKMNYSRDAKEALLWEIVNDNGIMYYTNEINWTARAIEKISKKFE